MHQVWKLTYTTVGGRPGPGTRSFDSEASFLSAVVDVIADLRKSQISAVLPNGTILDEAQVRGLVS